MNQIFLILNTYKSAPRLSCLGFCLLSIFLTNHAWSQDLKVIYGKDKRKDAFLLNDKKISQWRESIAMQVEGIRIISRNNDSYFSQMNLTKDFGICSTEKFTDQNSVGLCSGFLIAPKIILTAGHCLKYERYCQDYPWYFGYMHSLSDRKIDSRNLYYCKKILDKKQNGNGLDYAIIELDRVVEHRPFLKFRKTGKIPFFTPLLSLGHPMGLPMKAILGGRVLQNNQRDYFKANLDTFMGSSGSPVINLRTGLVEGILTSGGKDFVYDDNKKCLKTNQCSQWIFNEKKGCDGETVTRMTSIPLNY